MKRLLKDWFTGIYGETFYLGRALWASTATTPLLVGLGQVAGTVASLFHAVPLPLWSANDWMQWSGGTSGLLLAGAGALSLKKSTEPSTTTSRTVVATPGALAGTATEQSNA